MKVTLDLTDLVAKGAAHQGRGRQARAGLAQQDTGSLGSNILLGFGTVAVALGGGFLFPTAQSVIVMGVVLFVLGLALILNRQTQMGAVRAVLRDARRARRSSAASLSLRRQSLRQPRPRRRAWRSRPCVAAVGAAGGADDPRTVASRSAAGTAYWHASYFFGVDRPALTIGVLAVVTLALFFVSLRLPSAYERVCIIAARTAILMINLAFLVGSLFGDHSTLGLAGEPGSPSPGRCC